MSMDRTIKLKLKVSDQDAETLRQTIVVCNEVFDEIATFGFENRTNSKIKVHHGTYYPTRERHPEIPSALLQGVRDVACEALKSVKLKTLPKSTPFSAIRYNKRVVRINFPQKFISIASVGGRIKATFDLPEYYYQYLHWEIRSSTLWYDKRSDTFYLHVTMRTNPPEPSGDQVLGIDRGIVNVAVCSNNRFFNGKQIKNVRGKYKHLRAKLQSKGTKSAKRLLKKISRKEKRFVKDVNHCISKEIVNMPFDVFALEDLTSIRVQNRRRGREFNRKLNNWSFYQLEEFIRYKSEALGKQVVSIDSRYTSQKCSKCGHTYKGNRKGNDFRCRKCGYHVHADLNAAFNIAAAGISCIGRASVNSPDAGDYVFHDSPASSSPSGRGS